MKFTSERKALRSALADLSRTIPKSVVKSEYSHVLCRAATGGIQLIGGYGDRLVRIDVDAEDVEPGEILVPAQLFLELMRTCSVDKIVARLEDMRLCLDVGAHRVRIKCLPPKELYEFPDDNDGKVWGLVDDGFSSMIRKVEHAAAKDIQRPMLAGLLLKFGSTGLEVVAMDGLRLARCKNVSVRNGQESSILVSRDDMNEWVRLSAKGPVRITVYEERGVVRFDAARKSMVAGFIAGMYPDYTSFIPSEYSARILVDTKELARVALTASLFTGEPNNAVGLQFGDGRLGISTAINGVGDATAALDVEISGDPFPVFLNVQYLLDVLGAIDTERVAIELVPSGPIIFRTVGNDDYLGLVMPVAPSD